MRSRIMPIQIPVVLDQRLIDNRLARDVVLDNRKRHIKGVFGFILTTLASVVVGCAGH